MFKLLSFFFRMASMAMKRPANHDVAAARRDKNDQKLHDGLAANKVPKQEVINDDDDDENASCRHPTSMKTAAGSNRYYARMVCRSCGLLLYKVKRQLEHGQPTRS